MSRINQYVIGEIELFEKRNATQKFRLQQKAVVRLGLNNVPDSHKLGITAEFRKLHSDFGRAKISPANDPENERRRFGQLQQPSGFFQRLPRLNRNGALKTCSVQLGLEVFGQEVALQRRHCVVNPFISLRAIAPEVLVGVDAHVAAQTAVEKCSPCEKLITRCRDSPSPSIPNWMASPAFRNCGGFIPNPTPAGVPVLITSPGSSVMNSLT